jgi:O-antigen/teichoic acid export membrane protein
VSTPELEAPPDPHLLDTNEAGGVAIRGTAMRTVGFGAITLLGLISAPLLTRHLGVVEFGRYSTVLSLVAVVSLVTEAGLGALAVRELAVLPPHDQRALMGNVLGIRLVLTVLGVALAIAFAAAVGYGRTLVLGTLVCGIGAISYIIHGALSLPFSASLRLGWLSASEVLRQAVLVALIVVVVARDGGMIALLAATIPAGLIGAGLLAWSGRGTLVFRPRFERNAWRRILRDTLPIAAASAMYSLYFRVVLLLMSVVAGAVETGYYALSFRVIDILVAVPFLVVGSLLPLLSRAASNAQERLAFGFRRTFDVCVIAGTGLAVLTFAGAPLAMSILTGHNHGTPVTVLEIQSVTLLTVFLNVCFATVLIALRRHRDLIAVNLLALGFTVLAAAIAVPVAGAEGGAAAATSGEWVLLAGYVIVLHRARPDLAPSLRSLRPAIVAAAIAIAASRVIDVPHLPNLGAVAIAGVVYVAILVVLRAVPVELTDALLRRAATPGS